jgi:hypothetical protein
LQIKHHLTEYSTIQIHAGNSSIWSSPWIPSWSNIHDHLLLPVINSPLPAKVSDLWLQPCRIPLTGIRNYSPPPSPNRWYNKSLPLLLFSPSKMTSSDGNQQLTAYVPPIPSTKPSSYNRTTPSPPQAPECWSISELPTFPYQLKLLG